VAGDNPEANMNTLTELSFGKRIEPEEVTPEVREELVRSEWWDEWMWIGLVVVGTVAVSLGISLAYRWHGEARLAELPSIALVAGIGMCGLLLVHLWFRAKRDFDRYMPATMGVVLKAEETYKYCDDSAAHQKTLTIRYVPNVKREQDVELALILGSGSMRLKTQLSPRSRVFAETIKEGGMVTLLYDPEHPKMVERTVAEHSHHVAA
jgi:hypothetical protein